MTLVRIWIRLIFEKVSRSSMWTLRSGRHGTSTRSRIRSTTVSVVTFSASAS